jgi:hypothetical protein
MLPPEHTQADKIIFTVLGAFIAFNLLRVFWQMYKDRREFSRGFRKMRAGWRKEKSNLAELRSSYRRGRQSGLGRSEAFYAAAEEEQGGERVALKHQPQPAKQPVSFVRLVQTLLVNSVSIIGVYRLHWPVGTALALYWSENLMTGVIVIGSTALFRIHQGNTEDQGPGTSVGEVAAITLVFNAAHFVFLLVFLGVMLPRVAPMERFERTSFTQGVAFIASLLLLEFIVAVLRMRRTSAAQLQQSVSSYLQRITVLHLTIIFGMFALALFGRARAFFAVFAGLKMIVDASRRV